MRPEPGAALVAHLSQALAGTGGARRPPLRVALEWLAARAPDEALDAIDAEVLAHATALGRRRTVAVLRQLERHGLGSFVHGRRGHPSRFVPARQDLGEVARRALAAPPCGAGSTSEPARPVSHVFQLRPGLAVRLELPADLTEREASRLAAFVGTLPFGAAPTDEPAGLDRHPTARVARPSVVLGLSALRISVPVMIALEHGLFAREGLSVEVRTFETAQPLVDAVADGRVEAGGFVAFPISMAAQGRGRVTLRHAATVIEDDAHPISRFVARVGSGVSRLEELAGRRVGILPTLAYRAWLELLARAAGVEPCTLEVIEVAPHDTVAAIEAGEIDALFTNDPAATAALSTGRVEPLAPEPRITRVLGDPLPFGSFVIGDALARERPEVARALVRAVDAAVDVAAASSARARAALAAHLPDTPRDLIRRYPPTRWQKTSLRGSETVARLEDRYRQLRVLAR